MLKDINNLRIISKEFTGDPEIVSGDHQIVKALLEIKFNQVKCTKSEACKI